jgi:hypothetical protein
MKCHIVNRTGDIAAALGQHDHRVIRLSLDDAFFPARTGRDDRGREGSEQRPVGGSPAPIHAGNLVQSGDSGEPPVISPVS